MYRAVWRAVDCRPRIMLGVAGSMVVVDVVVVVVNVTKRGTRITTAARVVGWTIRPYRRAAAACTHLRITSLDMVGLVQAMTKMPLGRTITTTTTTTCWAARRRAAALVAVSLVVGSRPNCASDLLKADVPTVRTATTPTERPSYVPRHLVALVVCQCHHLLAVWAEAIVEGDQVASVIAVTPATHHHHPCNHCLENLRGVRVLDLLAS